jgi:transposase-like protein
MSTCPHCQIEVQQVKVGRNPSGSQRYRCNVCNRKYTPEPNEAGYPQEVRDQAVRMYVDGLNFRRIARTLQGEPSVGHQLGQRPRRQFARFATVHRRPARSGRTG